MKPSAHRRLVSPGGRVLLALLLLTAIWLPSVFVSQGSDPKMVLVNLILTSAVLLILAPRRGHRASRPSRQDAPPRR